MYTDELRRRYGSNGKKLCKGLVRAAEPLAGPAGPELASPRGVLAEFLLVPGVTVGVVRRRTELYVTAEALDGRMTLSFTELLPVLPAMLIRFGAGVCMGNSGKLKSGCPPIRPP